MSLVQIAHVRLPPDGLDWAQDIGAIAGGHRHYYDSSTTNCAKAGTVIATVLAGPLNYVGVNPKISCKPSS